MFTAVVLLMLWSGAGVRGHGMMMDPPQRSSLWRFYESAPRNYEDNQLFCGGFSRQWNQNGGKCGVCGDPYDAPQPHENEAGGRFANGVITKTYRQGDVIDVAVKITANHMGYFVFKLCPNNDVKKVVTQDCLDKHVLQFVEKNGDRGVRHYIDSHVDTKRVKLQLPSDVTCSQCVLQWTYNTGNSWGCDGTSCGVGLGPQENFVNCADIAITADDSHGNAVTNSPVTTNQAVVTTKKSDVTTKKSDVTTMKSDIITQSPIIGLLTTPAGGERPIKGGNCRSVGAYAGKSDIDEWCNINCSRSFCPAFMCACS